MGGLGTAAFADPARGLVAVLFTQVGLGSPDSAGLFEDFRGAGYDD